MRPLLDDPAAGVVRETALALLRSVKGLRVDWLPERIDAARPGTSASPHSSWWPRTTAQWHDNDVSGGCESIEAGTCFAEMVALMEPARTLRKAMSTAKSVGADFLTEAYVMIDRMEKGVAVGVDQGGDLGNITSNRPDVFGSAHELSRWLDTHPALVALLELRQGAYDVVRSLRHSLVPAEAGCRRWVSWRRSRHNPGSAALQTRQTSPPSKSTLCGSWERSGPSLVSGEYACSGAAR
ncbi:hypothetical protein [Streptomyces sp. NPDC048224]|uniref:hypothetical protein n=1 Tax=Streptomyces sp. NPDC048224 TaxID=3154500 RepID=UPI0033D3F6A1